MKSAEGYEGVCDQGAVGSVKGAGALYGGSILPQRPQRTRIGKRVSYQSIPWWSATERGGRGTAANICPEKADISVGDLYRAP